MGGGLSEAGRVDAVNKACAHGGHVEALVAELDALKAKLDSVKAERDAALAACAEMRACIEQLHRHPSCATRVTTYLRSATPWEVFP